MIRGLFLPLEDDVIQKINYMVSPSMNIVVYFSILHFIFGITNSLHIENKLVGAFDLLFMGIFGLLIVYLKIPILFLLFSILCIIGSILHFNNITLPLFTLTDIVNITYTCGTVSCLACSIISVHIFFIITNQIDYTCLSRSINYHNLADEGIFIGIHTEYTERGSLNARNIYDNLDTIRLTHESLRCSPQVFNHMEHDKISRFSSSSPFIPFKGSFVVL